MKHDLVEEEIQYSAAGGISIATGCIMSIRGGAPGGNDPFLH